MIKITPTINLDETEIEFSFIRSPGPGGQNVNKVATAVQLRFNVMQSPSLPENVRVRALKLAGNRLTQEGVFIIKASSFRTQERNKQDALARLLELLRLAATIPKKRKKTRPTAASIERRLTKKKIHSKTKKLRQNKSFSNE